MKAINYTMARQNLAKVMDEVRDAHEPVIITRQSESAVVMISIEDYRALEETAYLLRSPKNARRLLDAIQQLEQGGGTARKLTEQ
ncbi:MAG: type II toxin-antitoxin system prevent-host-death family antitoxin [Desulfuromonadales bacterium]